MTFDVRLFLAPLGRTVARVAATVAVLVAAALPALSAEPIAKAVRVLDHLEIPRPIIMTHAGDGSGRFFIASQYGQIYVLESSASTAEPKLFMDLSDKVSYSDQQNEEGFLGMAFHPKFAENGKFYVYYTSNTEAHLSIVSSFTASIDRSTADPGSEVEVLRIPQPFWNHNGGTLAFGPDGMLYIALGDGGGARDPLGNGQNLGNLFGAILRIDVDRHDTGKGYAVPNDNPFVDREGACPEIWAYGLRNVWRMAFDRETGLLWAADVGQDVWEEIDLIVKGGNYGWSRREGFHPFGEQRAEAEPAKYVEPIFEYSHEVGKSITGGCVYRGSKVPALVGKYLYGDYVSGRFWALAHDPSNGKTENFDIEAGEPIAVITFGEDEQGEVFFSDSAGRIFSFE